VTAGVLVIATLVAIACLRFWKAVLAIAFVVVFAVLLVGVFSVISIGQGSGTWIQ
jgi:hypothetical protein